MGAFTYIETDTGTNVDISAATAVGAYTSTGDKLIMVDVSIDAVAGNGDYVMYVTRQIGGSGSAYRILPQTTMTAASGLTAISGQSGWITVRNGDVLTCYVVGLAGDTSTPDWSTRWFELAGVTAAGIADAVWDEATADHTTSTTFGGKNQKVVPSETVGDYKADVSGLATQASVNAIPTTPLLAANYTAPDNASIAAILEDTGTTIPATLAGLATSAEVGAITMLDEVIVGTYTMRQLLAVMASALAGKVSGGGTSTITFRGVDDASDVIVATVDASGNRSALTITV